MGVNDLTVARGSALYIGALLGPGLLLLPGLAAAKAGPASILAWAGLLVVSGLLAVVFAALGRSRPSASGVQAYAAAGLGRPGGRSAAWCFLAGIVTGAPVVCAIGGNYVAALTGGGRASAAIAGGVLLLAVLGVTAGGARSSARVQMVLVVLLLAVVAVAVLGAAPHARAASWTPFAPHGWAATGSAASVLMLSFVGWEAVAPLTARFRDPRRQLPKVIGVAFAATSVLYLSLAAVTIAVLGAGAGTSVPLASLLAVAVGPAGRLVAAVAAVLLTLGTTNAYLTGAAALARALTGPAPAAPRRDPGSGPARCVPERCVPERCVPARGFPAWLAAAIATAGAALAALTATGLASAGTLVMVPTTFLLAVYLGCTVSAVRVLRGGARIAAALSVLAVATVLAFSGWALLPAAAVTAAAVIGPAATRRARLRAARVSAAGTDTGTTRRGPVPCGSPPGPRERASAASGTAGPEGDHRERIAARR